MKKSIAVAGTGYVGLTTGTCFADLGNRVTCIDINPDKIAMLERGETPIYEPGLSEMITRNVKAGRLHFTTDYKTALEEADFVFICVGTPSGVDGEADLRYVRMAAESIAQAMTHPMIIVNKSTVPVGTGDWVSDIVVRSQPKPMPFDVVSCPEFMREGSALYDFMNPDRVVLGSKNKDAAEKVAQLHLPLRTRIVVTDLRTAEMIKYASNAFLATKISFINEIAAICERMGADVQEVAVGMGYDKRIGPHFLNAGLGYGGSCFPKDVKALEHMALVQGSHPALLRAVMDINRDARRWVIFQLRAVLGGQLRGRRIGLMGLAFKPNTDDIRESPALEIARMLQYEGVYISAYDPVAMTNAGRENPDLRLVESPYELADGADALVVCTEWNEFKQIDFPRIRQMMKQPVIIDGRNIYEPEMMQEQGFIYRAVGRGSTFDNASSIYNGYSPVTEQPVAPVLAEAASGSNGTHNSEANGQSNGNKKSGKAHD